MLSVDLFERCAESLVSVLPKRHIAGEAVPQCAAVDLTFGHGLAEQPPLGAIREADAVFQTPGLQPLGRKPHRSGQRLPIIRMQQSQNRGGIIYHILRRYAIDLANALAGIGETTGAVGPKPVLVNNTG